MFLKDGTRIFVDAAFRDGNKAAVVFIHGDGQNHTVWTTVMNYFFQKGHSVLCYDLPGHGLSRPYKDRKYSFFKFVKTLREVLKTHDLSRPIVVGNSCGGMIALKYATRNSVASVVAISACDESPSKHNPDINEVIKNYIAESKKAFKKQELFDYGKKKLNEKEIRLAALEYTSPESIEGHVTSLKSFDIRLKLRNIKVPVLLFRGTEDAIMSAKWMERMRKGLPSARLVSFKGHGHHVLLEAPEKVIRAIEENYSFLVQE